MGEKAASSTATAKVSHLVNHCDTLTIFNFGFHIHLETNQFSCRAEDEDEEDSANIEGEIEAILEEEYPIERYDEYREEDEVEEATTERLHMEIEERYVADSNNMAIVLVNVLHKYHQTLW